MKKDLASESLEMDHEQQLTKAGEKYNNNNTWNLEKLESRILQQPHTKVEPLQRNPYINCDSAPPCRSTPNSNYWP
jgi:hypothetical protein